MKKSLILLIFVGFGLLAGCGDQSSTQPVEATLTMRTYTVPASQAESIANTIRGLLSTGKGSTTYLGDASIPEPGRIMVLAPARMQDSIAESIHEIVSHASETTKAEPLRLNAWVVDVHSGAGATDPSLKTIQPALDAFATDMGPSHFVSDHYFTSVSDAGSLAETDPLPRYMLHYRVTNNGNGLLLDFNYHQPISDINFQLAELRGQVTTKLGQTLVLGLISDQHQGNNKADASVRRLLVIRIVPADQG